MKLFKSLSIFFFTAALMSCDGGNGVQQQQTPVPADQQPVAAQAPLPDATDSTLAQQQSAPAAQPAPALPEPITAFLSQHFPDATVALVETDAEHGGLEYDVTLNDGTEVDFDTRNQWESVDCKVKPVPAALVPNQIAAYVKTNYNAAAITKIDNKRYGYEVELSNGLDLKFDNTGRFVGIDD